MRIDFLAESADSFRNQDIVDPELEVGVFVANMELPKGILCDAWSLQDDVVEWRIRAMGERQKVGGRAIE